MGLLTSGFLYALCLLTGTLSIGILTLFALVYFYNFPDAGSQKRISDTLWLLVQNTKLLIISGLGFFVCYAIGITQ